jgi:single-stranded-DNA-specific exonuclease
LLVRDDSWAPGLVGLVAGRLADALARPVVAATLVGGEVRGSVRAPVDFNVAAALEACGAHLAKRGGHAAAGGFSLAPASWDAFVLAFSSLPRPFPADAAPEATRPGRQVVDLVLGARHLDWTLVEQLERLAPFGPGHLEPVVAVTGLVLAAIRRVGVREQHVAFKLRRGIETLDAIAFAMADDRPLPEVGDEVDLLGTIERDDFGGLPRYRLRLLDFAHRGASPLVARRALPALARAG